MIQTVIKRDGSKEPFDSAKMYRSIMSAAKESGLMDIQAKNIADQVSVAVLQVINKKEEITTEGLRKEVFKELDRVAPKAADAWKVYEHLRTTNR